MPDKQSGIPPANPINWELVNASLHKRRFNSATAIKPEPLFLSIRSSENIIGTAGNLVAFTGLPKAGKSTFLSFCIASAITGETVNGFKVHTTKEKNRIGLIDTEQSPGDFSRKANIISKIVHEAGYKQDIFKNFDAFLLSDLGPGQIVLSIAAYLENTPNCAVLIIDGLLDCIDNMNDEIKTKKFVRHLKRLAQKYSCLIIGVLHLGKKDKLSLGHLGSAVDRAAQSVITIEKTKDQTFKAIPALLRSSQHFNEIEIGWNDKYKNFELLF